MRLGHAATAAKTGELRVKGNQFRSAVATLTRADDAARAGAQAHGAKDEPDGLRRWFSRGGGHPARRPVEASMIAPLALSALVFVAVTVSLLPARADAAYRHPAAGSPAETITIEGTEAHPVQVQGIGFDEAHKRLYATANIPNPLEEGQTPKGRLYGYSVPTPTTATALGAPFPLPLGENNQAYYYTAPDEANGNVYALRGGYPSDLYGFDSSGATLPGYPAHFPNSQCGLAVDGRGRVGEIEGNEHLLRFFDSSGAVVRRLNIASTGYSCLLAFDRTNEDLYIGGGNGLYRFSGANGYRTVTKLATPPGTVYAMAFDASRGILYVLLEGRIAAYDRSGKLIETFGQNVEEPYFQGIAVNEATGTVYAALNRYSAHSAEILPFPEVIVPDVTTGEPVGNETVSGTVDPAGGGNVTSCEVQYASEEEFLETGGYGKTAPCSPAPPYATTKTVTATLTGMRLRGSDPLPLRRRQRQRQPAGCRRNDRQALRQRSAHQPGNGAGTDLRHAGRILHRQRRRNHLPLRVRPNDHLRDLDSHRTSAGTATGAPQRELRTLRTGSGDHLPLPDRRRQQPNTSLGNDRTFTTVSAVENLTTEPAAVINGNEAILHASFTGNGEDTHYYFEYGYNTLYGSVSAAPPGVDSGTATGKINLSFPLQRPLPGHDIPLPDRRLECRGDLLRRRPVLQTPEVAETRHRRADRIGHVSRTAPAGSR